MPYTLIYRLYSAFHTPIFTVCAILNLRQPGSGRRQFQTVSICFAPGFFVLLRFLSKIWNMNFLVSILAVTALNLMEMDGHLRFFMLLVVALAAYLIDFLCCKLLSPMLHRIALKTPVKWDNYLTERKVLNNIFHLIPPVCCIVALPILFPVPNVWTRLLDKALDIYIITVACRLFCEFISSIYALSNENGAWKDRPMKGVYQMLKVIVIGIGVILTIGVLVNKDFTTLIAGLGASAAVLMLIFKDTILGVVAGVQLSAYDMLHPGDWIVLEKYDVNGEVEEVNMNTVKVRNWDKSITTIPPYVLVSDSFKNWRGMREGSGRRVARSILIDMNSIRFCTPEEVERFSSEEWSRDMEIDGQTVNLRLFRASVEHYLRKLPEVNGELMLLVRQLEPTSEGLPLQLYFFTRQKDWVPHEKTAADVFEHVIASMPEFGLKVFQRPAGTDISGAKDSITK